VQDENVAAVYVGKVVDGLWANLIDTWNLLGLGKETYLEVIAVLIHVLKRRFEDGAFSVSFGSNGLRKTCKVRDTLNRLKAVQTLTYRSLRDIPALLRVIVVGGAGEGRLSCLEEARLWGLSCVASSVDRRSKVAGF
jgi:hypothetical protein